MINCYLCIHHLDGTHHLERIKGDVVERNGNHYAFIFNRFFKKADELARSKQFKGLRIMFGSYLVENEAVFQNHNIDLSNLYQKTETLRDNVIMSYVENKDRLMISATKKNSQ